MAEALDESALSQKFPSTLHNLEATPPSGAWEKINEALIEPETKVVPMRKRNNGFIRYAAAAAIIGIIAWGVTRFVGAGKNEAVAKTNEIIPADPINGTPERKIDVPTPAVPVVTDNADQALENSKQTIASNDSRTSNARTRVPRIEAEDDVYATSVRSGSLSKTLYTYEDHIPNIAEKYVTVMTPDGGFIRMAKKWSSLLCCISGEDQDKDCKDQLKKWQDKMAATPVNTPGNFIELLDLVNTLNSDTQL